jgi:hypothetical protein
VRISAVTLPAVPSSWHVIGTGDFFGNGLSDILWQNTDGTPAIWEMDGTSIVGAATLPNPGTSWHAIGTGDYYGDGKDDILWQNADGAVAIWEMNGLSIIGAPTLPNPGSSWQLKNDGPIPLDQMGTTTGSPSQPTATPYLSAPDAVNLAAPTGQPVLAGVLGGGTLTPSGLGTLGSEFSGLLWPGTTSSSLASALGLGGWPSLGAGTSVANGIEVVVPPSKTGVTH